MLAIDNPPGSHTGPEATAPKPTLKELYAQLSNGKKRLLLSRYMRFTGYSRASFFSKVLRGGLLRPFEVYFFSKELDYETH